jgi:hypothetical protein
MIVAEEQPDTNTQTTKDAKKKDSWCRKIYNGIVRRPLRFAFRVAAASLIMTAIPTTFEWYGYSMLDTDDRTNIITSIDPYARHLTDGEITMAKEVFGDQIDYNTVKVFDRRFMFILGNNHAQAMAPNGNIYYPDSSRYSDDFSQDNSRSKKALFMHEMTHVWQYQHGVDLPGSALLEYLSHGCDYGEAYKVDTTTPKKFEEYGIEQQAEIVEEYVHNRKKPTERTRVCADILSEVFDIEPLTRPTISPEKTINTASGTVPKVLAP